MNIASHGRAGKPSASVIASFGRLQQAVQELIEVIKTEIIHLVSTIRTSMDLESRVDD